MRSIEIDISNESSLPEACKKLLAFSGAIKVFAFDAPMGAGKTTFIKQLCKSLGSNDSFSSPTYSIVNEYNSPHGKLYHFDMYRIKNADELYDIGFEEYIDSHNYCFIEWPQLDLNLLPKPYMMIIIKANENNRYLRAQIIE